MSVYAKKQSTLGPGHDGGFKDGFLAKSGEAGLVTHHGPGLMTNAPRKPIGCIARDGSPKNHLPVSVNKGCQLQPEGGRGHPVGVAPLDDGGSPVSVGVHPFSKPPAASRKLGAPLKASPGIRASFALTGRGRRMGSLAPAEGWCPVTGPGELRGSSASRGWFR